MFAESPISWMDDFANGERSNESLPQGSSAGLPRLFRMSSAVRAKHTFSRTGKRVVLTFSVFALSGLKTECHISKWGICPHGIFDPWAWYSQGSARYTEFLGRRCRGRRRRHLVQIWAKVQFLQNGHIPKFQETSFFRKKSPCGSFPQKVTFSESTSRELTQFYRDLKIGGPPHFRGFGNVFPRLCQFWSKTKLVRMVQTNNCYETMLEVSDPKDQLWTKTEILEGWEISKFSFEVHKWLLRVSTRPKWILKIFWNIPESF